MHNSYRHNKRLNPEFSARETYLHAVDKLRKEGQCEAKPSKPIYKNDIEAVFSQALMRRLGEMSCDDSGVY